ncbi:M1 family metallopeptidase [Sphingomonas oligophenolica]|uniref:Aminopeptidase n=1 Tax=Sphingomonas oligophenolica TaxID=301154 RepID=A0ABU9Y1W0_9SPHN
MRAAFAATCLSLLSTTAFAQAAPPPAAAATMADPAAPKGKLSDAATPVAYRLDFTILPDQPRFSGHDEIDINVKAATKSLYLHGRNLNVSKAVALVGGKTIAATWTQVDKTGVVRLDFATPLPGGAATLVFDYDGAFGDDASGLYHIKVGDIWYSWTQFESIDARAAYPGFDEPGFKTPFTISITTIPGYKAASNAPEAGVTKAGALEKHQFAATRPLPTYLVALITGPFLNQTGAVPPTPERASPLPLGVFATQAQAGKLDYVMAETPRIVSLLEKYFGEPFPFPKLDQIASPVMPGAMENAGADTYGDGIILLDNGAPTGQRQEFGMVVAHELSHQWFGDLVSPAWWDDIWLNESFANWMGYRIGNEWRPELNIGVGALDEGFRAMNTDALEVGRPIHQPITENSQIDSAFDNITYGKGGHVIAMIAAYLGDEKFKAGVRLHLKRHAYGNATSEQFFQSLADGAGDPRVLTAMKSFVDQQGVPVVNIARQGGKLVATQSRYAFLGSHPAPEQWTIPFCLRVDAAKSCTLLDKPVTTLSATGGGVIMPNVGGTGYYRFNLEAADWQKLIGTFATLSPGEALAADDSLWAAFRAGNAPARWLVTAARTLAANPDSDAAVDGGSRLAGLKLRGLIGPESDAAYRGLMDSIYAPRLAAIGFNPAAGAHLGDAPDKQKLRQNLVGFVVGEGHDAAVSATLEAAAEKYLAGDKQALDQAYLGVGLGVVVTKGGLPAAKKLVEIGLASEDPTLRQSALGAAAGSGRTDVAQYLLGLNDKRLRPFDKIGLIFGLATSEGTADFTGEWILANYDTLLAGGNGIFITSRLPQALAFQCGADRADRINSLLGPKVRAAGAGVLTFERTIESIRHCGDLRAAKSAEIAAAIAAAG